LKVGDRARVRVIGNNLVTSATGAITGKDPPFLTAPSLDVPVCSAAIQKFSQSKPLGQELTDFVEVLSASAEALQAIA